MDMWIDIIEDNTAAVFCCGIAFMVNTDTNPRGLPVLLKNLLATTESITLCVRDLRQKSLACVFTFASDKYYHIFQEGSLLPYLISLIAISNSGVTWDAPTNWVPIPTSSLWLYDPHSRSIRFQNPNVNYSFIMLTRETTILVLNKKEKKVDLYLSTTIQGILLAGLHLKPYFETIYHGDTHSK